MTRRLTPDYTCTIRADIDLLFEAFTERRALKEWLASEALTIPRVGGPICLWWKDGTHIQGAFTRLVPNSEIGIRWRANGDSEETDTSITLASMEDGVQVEVAHSSPSALAKFPWNRMLDNLAVVFGQKGVDQRMLMRPDGSRRASLGFFVGPTAPAVSSDLPPHTFGMRVVGTFPETPAHDAGLRRDDVIVDVAGQPVFDLFSYSHALDAVSPGETVEIRRVRAGSLDRLSFATGEGPETLPLPPVDPVEFAKQLQGMYEEFDTELDALLSEVSDEEASWKPHSDAWSIKDVLAHLIPFERMFHHWMGAAAVGFEPYTWVEHPALWTAGLQDVFPTLPELRDELSRARRETVAYLKLLPDVLTKRPTYRRMGMIILLDQFHPRHHHEQIKRIRNAFKIKGD